MKILPRLMRALGIGCLLAACQPFAVAQVVSNTTTHQTYATIGAALAALAADGQSLHLSPGAYTEPMLDINWAVTIQGDDAATTIIQPAAAPGAAATRVARVWIPGEYGVTLPVVFERLTLRHGNTTGSGGALFVEEGTAVVRHCVVGHNAASIGGGLAAQAGGGASLAVEDSAIITNTATTYGGGLVQGEAARCVLAGNVAPAGGGAAYARLAGCTVADNAADTQGGGLLNGIALRCVLRGNTATYGGAACQAVLVNTLAYGNVAAQSGGALYLGQATNCTLAANQVATAGGGLFGGGAVNTILEGNTGGDAGGDAVLAYCRSAPLAAGDGNIDDPPDFNNPAGGDYTLAPASPCRDAGADGSAPPGTDLAGAARIQGSAVDMGAYEAIPANTVATPTFTPLDGATFAGSQAVTLACATAGAAIRYTLDGSDPTAASALYTAPVQLTQTTTVKARGFAAGMIGSAIATATYTRLETVATPTFAPLDGATFTGSQAVTLACATPGAAIRYTLDGSEPTAGSALYTVPLQLTQTTTVKARAFVAGMADSAVASASYTRLAQVGTPVFAPVSGTTFVSAQAVTITCATPGAAIRYTLDGSEPTAASALYTAPVQLTQTTTVKARAFVAGMADSAAASATYTRVVTLAAAVDAPGLVFTTGGDAPWFIQSAVKRTGDEALQSGAITHRQTSWVETTVTNAGSLSFWWQVSCEDDTLDDWDYVAVAVDGAERARLDGEEDWTEVVLALGEGTHMVRWTYTKDRVQSEGQDCAWLDTVTWRPAISGVTQLSPVPVPHAWLETFNLPQGGEYETAAMADVDGDGHCAWQEYVTGSCPTNRQSVFRVALDWLNGAPRLTWYPDLGAAREYTVRGKAKLSDAAWQTPTNAASRFFRVDAALR